MNLDALLAAAVERGASDIHFKPDAPPVVRIHGRLEPQAEAGVVTADFMDAVARRILSERLQTRLKEIGEVDAGYSVAGLGRFRVNMFLALGVVRAVMRAIPSKKPEFEELGLPPVLTRLAMERRGLVIVTGVTGSG